MQDCAGMHMHNICLIIFTLICLIQIYRYAYKEQCVGQPVSHGLFPEAELSFCSDEEKSGRFLISV